jgi:hypothetical protein
VTALLFFAWREIQGAVPAENNHPYFRFGWGPTLVLFGVSIDSWYKYAVIQCYQVARAVLNSVVLHIYMPWLSSTLTGTPPKDAQPLKPREYWLTLAGQAAVTTATWWSTGAAAPLPVCQQFALAGALPLHPRACSGLQGLRPARASSGAHRAFFLHSRLRAAGPHPFLSPPQARGAGQRPARVDGARQILRLLTLKFFLRCSPFAGEVEISLYRVF